jgi:hypothetical protein
MGIEVNYRLLRRVELDSLLDMSQGDALEFLIDMQPTFRIGKQWHVLFFVLTNASDLDNPISPLADVIVGGIPTPYPSSYGLFRYLLPEKIADLSRHLSQIEFEDLEGKFDADTFSELELYPGGWTDDSVEQELESMKYLFQSLVDFFDQVAEHGDCIIISMD